MPKNIHRLTILSETKDEQPSQSTTATAAAATATETVETAAVASVAPKPALSKARPPPLLSLTQQQTPAVQQSTTTANSSSSSSSKLTIDIEPPSSSSSNALGLNSGDLKPSLKTLSDNVQSLDITANQKGKLEEFLKSREKIGDLTSEDLSVEGELGSGNGGVVLKVRHRLTSIVMAKKVRTFILLKLTTYNSYWIHIIILLSIL